MYPSASQQSPVAPVESPEGPDPRVEAFREFLASLDRTESVLTPMRRLRRLGLSVCVVSPEASRHRRKAGDDASSEQLTGGTTQPPREDRPPLLALEVSGEPVSWESWDDSGDDLAIRWRRDRLDDWLTAVARAALAAVGPNAPRRPGFESPVTGPVHVDLSFIARSRNEAIECSPWVCPVQPNGTKADPSVPNIDGLTRATLGALVGIILADVSQVASIAARKVYGPSPGVSIAIHPA